MQNRLKTYARKDIAAYTRVRKGELKLGEKITLFNTQSSIQDQLLASKTKYVILGVPEDIGVVGNFGKKGTRFAWEATMRTLLNIQHNDFYKGNKLFLLGYLDFQKELEQLEKMEKDQQDYIEYAREITREIDRQVTYLVQIIVQTGKIPVIIGGGHNNSYGIIKGCALAINKPLNVLNLDAHTDFRPREGRHSGNGFSYAYYEGFLKKYFIFGLHEGYTSKAVFDVIEKEKENIRYTSYEELEVKRTKGIPYQINIIQDFIAKNAFGIEVDCDVIQNMPSSAMSPSGLTLEQTRHMVYSLGRSKNVKYLHICEAAPDPNSELQLSMIGKAISYLICDFTRK